MKIYLVSDLHVEFFKDFPLPTAEVDVVVLAGDIHHGSQVLDVARAYQRSCHVPVILVAGNHEYYHAEFSERLSSLRREAAKLPNIHFLENDSVVIGGVRFLGCTLWSDFRLYGEESVPLTKWHAIQCISDFNVIRSGNRRFIPDTCESLFKESYAWLEQALATPFDGPTVVVTHFLPHRAGIHPKHLRKPDDELTPYFTVDCSMLMRQYPMAAWLYGHTHNSIDIIVENGTRLISNQRGYPNEPALYTQFDPEKIIDICVEQLGSATLPVE